MSTNSYLALHASYSLSQVDTASPAFSLAQTELTYLSVNIVNIPFPGICTLPHITLTPSLPLVIFFLTASWGFLSKSFSFMVVPHPFVNLQSVSDSQSTAMLHFPSADHLDNGELFPGTAPEVCHSRGLQICLPVCITSGKYLQATLSAFMGNCF